MKKLLLLFILCSVFLSCNNASASDGKDGKDGVNGKDGASIVWKGAFSNADQIENPEYLWVYYNTEDGCSYIYDGEKWVLFAAGNKQDGTLDGSEVFIVKYQTGNGTEIDSFYCTYGYKITSAKLPEITKKHYTFDAWYDGETKVSENYKITKNTTLTAKWIADKCKITYVCDDDSVTVPEPVFVDYGTVLDSSYFPSISKDGVNYEWFENTYTVGAGYHITEDVTFIAILQKDVKWGRLYGIAESSGLAYGLIYFESKQITGRVQFGIITMNGMEISNVEWHDAVMYGMDENNYVFESNISINERCYILFSIILDNERLIFESDENGSEPIALDSINLISNISKYAILCDLNNPE